MKDSRKDKTFTKSEHARHTNTDFIWAFLAELLRATPRRFGCSKVGTEKAIDGPKRFAFVSPQRRSSSWTTTLQHLLYAWRSSKGKERPFPTGFGTIWDIPSVYHVRMALSCLFGVLSCWRRVDAAHFPRVKALFWYHRRASATPPRFVFKFPKFDLPSHRAEGGTGADWVSLRLCVSCLEDARSRRSIQVMTVLKLK